MYPLQTAQPRYEYNSHLFACIVSYKPHLRCFRIYCSAISAFIGLDWNWCRTLNTTLATHYQLLSQPAGVKEFWTSVKTACRPLLPQIFMTWFPCSAFIGPFSGTRPHSGPVNTRNEIRDGHEMLISGQAWQKITTSWKLPNVVSDLVPCPGLTSLQISILMPDPLNTIYDPLTARPSQPAVNSDIKEV